jgi:hypothetical protein
MLNGGAGQIVYPHLKDFDIRCISYCQFMNNQIFRYNLFTVLADIYIFLISLVGLCVLRPLTGPLYQPPMIGDGDCGQIGGMKIGRGNRSTRRKHAPAPLCPPQISHA